MTCGQVDAAFQKIPVSTFSTNTCWVKDPCGFVPFCLGGSQSLGIPGCGPLSGGNVGGEMVQKEEEGGRKGTVWCGDFWKEFFHPCVTSSYRKGRVNVTEWLPEGCVFCSQVFVLSPLPRRWKPQITGTGGDTPSKGWTDSGCGWWLLKVRVTLAGRVWSLLVAGSSKWLR